MKALDVDCEYSGDRLRFETKQRAHSSACSTDATVNQMALWVVDHVKKAGVALRKRTKDEGVHALQVVYIASFLPANRAQALHQLPWAQILSRHLGPQHPVEVVNPYHLPHGVAIHWYGIDRDGEWAVADSLPHYLDVPFARPRSSSESIQAWHRMMNRPPSAPDGLSAR